MAISLPLVLLILDYLKEGSIKRRALIEKIPFLFLSVIFGIVTIDAASSFGHLEGMEYSFAWINRPFILSYAVSLYLVKFLLPIRLSVIYGFPEESGGTLPILYYLSMILFILIVLGLWRLKTNKKELWAGMIFFLVTIAPVLPIFWSRMFLAGERYVYLPYLGLIFMLGAGVQILHDSRGRIPNKYRTGLIAILAVFLLFLGISTFQRTKVWDHPESLLTAVIDQNPSKNTLAAAYFFRGNIRDRYQDYPGALGDFNESLKRNPDNVLALNNRGIVRGIMNDFEGAVIDFGEAMKLNPEYVDAYYNRGIAYYQLKKYPMACQDWEKASSMGSTMARTALQKYCRSNNHRK
jgi:tetratricopeptide (TPR) repeat protein